MRVGPPRTDFALRTVVIGDHAIASAASATDTMWRAEGDGPQFGPHDDPTTGPTRESESQEVARRLLRVLSQNLWGLTGGGARRWCGAGRMHGGMPAISLTALDRARNRFKRSFIFVDPRPPAPRPPLGSPVRLSALYGASDGRRYILLQMYPDPASDYHGASDFVHVLLVRVLK